MQLTKQKRPAKCCYDVAGTWRVRLGHFDNVAVDLHLRYLAFVKGEFTEVAHGQHLAEFVLGDCLGSRIDGGIMPFDEHGLGIHQAEKLNGIVSSIEIGAVAKGNVLPLLGVCLVLFAAFVGSERFLERRPKFFRRLFPSGIPFVSVLSDEQFNFHERLLDDLVIGEAEVGGVAGEFARRFRQVGKAGETATLNGPDCLGDLCYDVLINHACSISGRLYKSSPR